MPYLGQIIMTLPRLTVMAESVLQVTTLIFLRIKPFILNRPSSPSRLRKLFYIPFRYGQVCQKIEWILFLPAFPILYKIHMVSFIYDPCNIIIPDSFFFMALFLFSFPLSDRFLPDSCLPASLIPDITHIR